MITAMKDACEFMDFLDQKIQYYESLTSRAQFYEPSYVSLELEDPPQPKINFSDLLTMISGPLIPMCPCESPFTRQENLSFFCCEASEGALCISFDI